MSTTPNFASILSESPKEVARRPPAPVGTYLCIVGKSERGESSKKKTPFLKFPLKPISIMNDVDEEALAELGGLEELKLSVTFYITEEAIPMLDQFHANCGIDLENDPGDRFQRNEDVINSQVLAVVTHRIDETDESRVFAEVRRTARAD